MSEIGDLLSMTLNQKSTDKITLEILIPTYKRPNSALDAVMTCLRSQDQRVAVFCHSNGFEPALEILRSIASNVHYDCFPENRGVHANFLKLLGSKRAKFVMLLSDEDRIDPKLLSPLLDFLDNNCRSDLVTCSVLNTNGTYYYNAKIHNANWMNANTGLIVDPFGSSYMSGWIYRTEELTDRVLKNGCRESMGNAYPHIMLKNELLGHGINLFSQPIIQKGEEVKYGGDGYSHKADKNMILIDGNLDLNPNVYGAKARARQYFYIHKNISDAKDRISKIVYIYVQICLFIRFFNVIRESRNVVNYPFPISFRVETLKAYNEALLNEEINTDTFTKLFVTMMVDGIPWIYIPVLKLVGLMMRIFRFGCRKIFILQLILKYDNRF